MTRPRDPRTTRELHQAHVAHLQTTDELWGQSDERQHTNVPPWCRHTYIAGTTTTDDEPLTPVMP